MNEKLLEKANQLARYIQELRRQEQICIENDLPALALIRKERLAYQKELEQLEVEEE